MAPRSRKTKPPPETTPARHDNDRAEPSRRRVGLQLLRHDATVAEPSPPRSCRHPAGEERREHVLPEPAAMAVAHKVFDVLPLPSLLATKVFDDMPS